jgi:hypothetical protein
MSATTVDTSTMRVTSRAARVTKYQPSVMPAGGAYMLTK